MKWMQSIATVLFAGALTATPATMIAQYGYGQPGYSQPGYNQTGYKQGQGAWDATHNEYRQAVQRDGFRAGLNGAQKDFENRRRPDVMNRDEYRNYRGPNRRAYQNAFQRGYSAWWSHQGGPPRGYGNGPRPY